MDWTLLAAEAARAAIIYGCGMLAGRYYERRRARPLTSLAAPLLRRLHTVPTGHTLYVAIERTADREYTATWAEHP